MHTTEILARALEAAGLPEVAAEARTGRYHDFLSELDFPEMALAERLAKIGTPEALRIREGVINGDYDASKEESDEWAKSPEGQETFGRLVKGT